MSLMYKVCLIKHMKDIIYLFAISITNIYISPASNLAYLDPSTIFMGAKLFIGTPEMLNKVVLK